jgi:hypothetical protein
MEQQNKKRKGAEFGLIAGVGLGLIVGLIFKKLAMGLLLGIIVAALLYRASK